MEKLLKPYKNLPRGVYVIFLSRVINAAGIFIMPLLSLILKRKLGMGNVEIGIISTISMLMFFPASAIGGKISDRFGTKKIIGIFDSLAALMYIITFFVGTNFIMIYFIMAAAFFFGIAEPAHQALMADITKPEEREGAFSLSYLGFNLGFIVGPILGGILMEKYLSALFLVDGITSLIATMLVIFMIKNVKHVPEEGHEAQDGMEASYKGSVLSLLIERPIIALFAIGLIGFSFTYSQWGFLVPLNIEHIFMENSGKFYGVLASTNAITVIAMTPVITYFADRFRAIDKIIIGGITYLVGFTCFAVAHSLFTFILLTFIFTLGEIIIAISSMPFILGYTPSSHRGRISSIVNIFMAVGYGLGPIVMGFVSTKTSFATSWTIIGIIMLISLLYMIVLKSNIERFKTAEENSQE